MNLAKTKLSYSPLLVRVAETPRNATTVALGHLTRGFYYS